MARRRPSVAAAEQAYDRARERCDVTRAAVMCREYGTAGAYERRELWRTASDAWGERERAWEALMAATEGEQG